jgi:hypothetical protein
MKVVPPGHMTDNMLDLPPDDDADAIGVRWIERHPSYSWVKTSACEKLTPAMVEEWYERLKTEGGPKKLVDAWELAKRPPSVWEYMLEKKLSYYRLVERYKSH